MELLEITGLKKSFGELEVLKGIDLSVNEKEVVSIPGPSGSVKSTFLRCISMLERPDEGKMVYCGKEAAHSEGGVIVEQGAPADVIDNPSNERTRAFLKKMEEK